MQGGETLDPNVREDVWGGREGGKKGGSERGREGEY